MTDSCYNYFEFLVARNLSYGSYGYNSYRPVLAGLQCTGREGSFSNCTPINGEALDSCGINQTAAVACEPIIRKYSFSFSSSLFPLSLCTVSPIIATSYIIIAFFTSLVFIVFFSIIQLISIQQSMVLLHLVLILISLLPARLIMNTYPLKTLK